MTICLEKKLFIRFTACVFHERLSISVCVSGGGGGGVWDLVILGPDHYLFFYFPSYQFRQFHFWWTMIPDNHTVEPHMYAE